MSHASRDTTTGLRYEDRVHIGGKGIDLSKQNLPAYFKEHYPNILYSLSYVKTCKRDKELYESGAPYILTKALLPDEAYFDPKKRTLDIYEKKTQNCGGSVDEKLQTCGYKIAEYRKIAKYLNVPPENVYYTYILDKWFNPETNPKYRDVLEYIKSVEGCDYKIVE